MYNPNKYDTEYHQSSVSYAASGPVSSLCLDWECRCLHHKHRSFGPQSRRSRTDRGNQRVTLDQLAVSMLSEDETLMHYFVQEHVFLSHTARF